MARKTKEERALEARQRAAYEALSPEQREKLDDLLAEVTDAYENVIMEAASAVKQAIEDENENLLATMAGIRQEFGDDAVEGALQQDAGIVVNLNLPCDLSCTIKEAEFAGKMQGAMENPESATAPTVAAPEET
jgi:hypothetical protein